MAAIGQVIDDKYEILKLIGQGGMSKVYLAMDKRLNKQWAIKEIEKRVKDKNNEVVIQSAIAEANLIKQLDHPAIVRIVDIIDSGNVIYIIEDYIEGETLSSILETSGAQPQNLVIEWAIQICSALEYLHTRKPPIIYRDMKPANIMLKPDGNIKVIDFGIAREYKDQNLGDTVNLGTKGYAAPEQFGGRGQTDARTDIYCLGVTLYHLVTGQNPCEPPYELYPIRHWNPGLSVGLEEIIQKCTQLNPADRYQSCAELLYALKHYEEYGAVHRAKQKKKLTSFILTSAAVVVFSLVGVLGLAMRTQVNNADYEQNIMQAENATNPEEQVDFYSKAIDIKPLSLKPYLGIIDAFKDDTVFTVDEETKFKNKINANLAELRNQPGYAELAFEIGKLYWYYYDYGKSAAEDNQLTRMKSSIQWFEDAVLYGKGSDDFYTMATVYSDIGKFNKDIVIKVQESTSDKGLYAPYWENIKKLLNVISGGGEQSEIVQLEVYRLAVYSIENYAVKFKSDGVEQQDIETVFNSVKTSLDSLTVTLDNTKEMKQNIVNRYDEVSKAIENAYKG